MNSLSLLERRYQGVSKEMSPLMQTVNQCIVGPNQLLEHIYK